MPHGQDAGFLGKAYDPFVLNANPSEKDFKVPDLLPPKEISEVRMERRREMRELVDSSVRNFEYSEQAKLMDSNFESAYRIMTSTQAREAFDLTKEPLKVRERYGLNRFGQSCLLARRPRRARRAFRHCEHFYHGLWRDYLGHPRLQALHQHRRHERHRRADV
jgi:hypothetical protein